MKQWLKKYHIGIILLIVLFYCGFLLFYQLGHQSFWIDEGYSSYVAKYMSINGLYKSSYFIFEWLQALCFKLGGINDFWARFPSVLFQLMSIALMYFIPANLSKNRYVGLCSSIIFGLLYRELGWGRDARFYSLIQFMLLLGILLIEKWIDEGKVWYLNSSLLLAGLGMIFHPFLYCLSVIVILAFILQYKKRWDKKLIFSKKYLSTWIIVLVGLLVVLLFGTLGSVLKGSLTGGLPWDMKKYYFIFYNKHLWSELGALYALGIVGMVWFAIKKKFKEVIFLFVPFVLFIYALVIKGYLMHSRYALLMFPLMIISTCLFVYDIFSLLKKNYLKLIFLLLIILVVGGTGHFQYYPINTYYFDYTSPQPDFKSAYASIPSKSKVISGFPTLCDWYYADRGKCSYAIRVDLILDGKTKITTKKQEKYTKIDYIDSIYYLKPGAYYFVIDDLTYKSQYINWELYEQVFSLGEIVFQSGEGYNAVVVVKVRI